MTRTEEDKIVRITQGGEEMLLVRKWDVDWGIDHIRNHAGEMNDDACEFYGCLARSLCFLDLIDTDQEEELLGILTNRRHQIIDEENERRKRSDPLHKQ